MEQPTDKVLTLTISHVITTGLLANSHQLTSIQSTCASGTVTSTIFGCSKFKRVYRHNYDHLFMLPSQNITCINLK